MYTNGEIYTDIVAGFSEMGESLEEVCVCVCVCMCVCGFSVCVCVCVRARARA